MRLWLWAGWFFLALSSPASAADWWWIGLNGDAPNRVITYVDRETIASGKQGSIDVWAMAFSETALPNGQQHQATHYGFRCRQRSIATLGRVAYDASGSIMPLAEVPPTPFTRAVPDSIGESILRFVCGQASGMEVRVDDPGRHAADYLAGRGTQSAGDTPPGAPDAGSGLSVGTGFFIGPRGDLLTSFHVIDGADRIVCRMPNGDIHPATVARISAANDLALLHVNYRPTNYLGFAPPGSLRPGDRIFTVGYGAAGFLGVNEPRFTDGSISALSGPGAEDAYMQISVPVQPGNSGGPVVNESGQVVGVVAAQAAVDAFLQSEGTLPQNINWAVKAEYASPLTGPLPAPPRRTRQEAIETARNSICLLVVERSAD